MYRNLLTFRPLCLRSWVAKSRYVDCDHACASGTNPVEQLSRPQTVKKVWEYIRENELQDPSDRRQIRCDDAMRAVFKQDRVHMFTMTKILNQNLYNPDE